MAIRFHCSWEVSLGVVCGMPATHWDHMSDELPLCRDHAFFVLKKREKYGIGGFISEIEKVDVGKKLCQSCHMRYDGMYISHKPNCNKWDR